MDKDSLIPTLLDAVPDLIALYQFGSQGKEKMHKESDLDLAILTSTQLRPVQRFDLEQELAILARKSVDLIDLRQASTVMRMQVISSGTCLFSANETERTRFEMVVYSAYARLNEERREILKSILQRGKIYA